MGNVFLDLLAEIDLELEVAKEEFDGISADHFREEVISARMSAYRHVRSKLSWFRSYLLGGLIIELAPEERSVLRGVLRSYIFALRKDGDQRTADILSSIYQKTRDLNDIPLDSDGYIVEKSWD